MSPWSKTSAGTQLGLCAGLLVALAGCTPWTTEASDRSPRTPCRVALQGGTIDVRSGSVFYLDSANLGPPVLFLHAGSGNSSLWEHQIPVLTAKGYRFIAFDRANHGRSRRDLAAPYSTSDELDQLLTALGLTDVHLVGVAAGGGVALRYAINHPERVRSLVIANSIGDVTDASYVELGERLRPPAFAALPLELRELGPSYRAAQPKGVERWLARSETRRSKQATGQSPSPSPPRESPVTFAALTKLRMPILLLTGDADLYTPPAVLEVFKRYLPHAQSVVVPASGHASYWENPAAFNAAIVDFLDRHSDRERVRQR